ncbi:MAG: cysteine-rich CWC family protein [Bacteroidales bacterium]|nr:cysteine-rich CWC family protein [Bacteroidales bacterium]
MQKVCPKCGKQFDCSQTEQCWCTKYEIPEDVANYLKENYLDCLCEDCLSSILKYKEKYLSGK